MKAILEIHNADQQVGEREMESYPARLEPHSAVYAASDLPMELPKTVHGQPALKVQNDIHKFKNCCISATQNPLLPH
jgi:hypothetical protein